MSKSWRKEKRKAGKYTNSIVEYNVYVLELNGEPVAEATMTGRQGVDNYPWEWYTLGIIGENDSGVTDSLHSAKTYAEEWLEFNLGVEELMTASNFQALLKVPVGDKFIFTSPYEHGPVDMSVKDFAARKGTEAEVIEHITELGEVDVEALPMYRIKFIVDGLVITAWPEEVNS